MIKKTKLYAFIAVMFMLNAVFFFGVFIAAFREKKGLAWTFWALAVSFGAAFAAFAVIYSAKENIRLENLRRAISERDHWFHTFEYPACNEPSVKIDETVIPFVETEED